MEHNPISMGDLAYGQASHNEAEITRLRAQVALLSNGMDMMVRWSEEIANILSDVCELVGYEVPEDGEFVTREDT